MLIKILICLLAGFGAGIGKGFAGLSAAAVIGPILVAFLDIPPYQAVGIGLVSDVLSSAASAITYKRNGNINIKNSIALIITILIMTVVGSLLASYLPDQTLSGAMQIGMAILGLKFLLFPNEDTEQQTIVQSKKRYIIKSIIAGSIVGFICGFVGAGGGMMLLLVLTVFLGYETHTAVGTSVFIMTFTALTGSIGHFAIGGVPNLQIMILCVIFTLIWAKLASIIANKSSVKTLNRVVGIVLIVTNIVILLVNYCI